MAMARWFELNVDHTSKHVCGRLRQPLKNKDRLKGGISQQGFVVLLINYVEERRMSRNPMENF